MQLSTWTVYDYFLLNCMQRENSARHVHGTGAGAEEMYTCKIRKIAIGLTSAVQANGDKNEGVPNTNSY